MEKMKYMDVEVILGNPKIKCDGYGICRFLRSSEQLEPCCINVEQIVRARIYIEADIIQFSFYRQSIAPETYKKYFSNKLFNIESELELPFDITNYWKLSPTVLKQGLYVIELGENVINISVTLKGLSQNDYLVNYKAA